MRKEADMRKIKIISGLFTIAVMSLIFFFSSQTADESSKASRGILDKVVSVLTVVDSDASKAELEEGLHILIRKAAHFTIYLLLGISAMNSACMFLKKSLRTQVFVSILFCALYAVSDEIHQYFVPGRAMMAVDVLIDTVGAAVGCGIFVFIGNKLLRRDKK